MLACGGFYFYDLNPVGPQSLLACLIVAAFTLFTSRHLVDSEMQRTVVASTPIVFIVPVLFLLETASRVESFSHVVAIIILAGFGFGYGIWCFRLETTPCCVAGTVATLIWGSFLYAIFISALNAQLNWSDWCPLFITILAFVSWMIWCGFRWRNYLVQQAQKAQDRFCWQCDYDLTGNLSGVCPECGRRIDNQKLLQH
ncbi:MAG: hypothetical protein HJJLKODD_00973 [Phycisphaerae bacterium]|nr:hypothetical protein [Phycisphaerae bacterium]